MAPTSGPRTVLTGTLRSQVESVVEKEMDALREVGNQTTDENVEKKSPMYSFLVVIEQPSGHNCYTGFTKTNGGADEKSFIEASQTNKCQELLDLCSQDESLLTVQHVVTDPKKGSVYFITDIVLGVEKYFELELKFQNLTPKSNEEWRQIHDIFWVTFRDFIQGLMVLSKNNASCGNVSLSTFVTKHGRGRILPSMDPASNQEADMRQLFQLMKTIITSPYPENDDVSFLPEDLKSFFDLVDNADSADSELQVRLLRLSKDSRSRWYRCFDDEFDGRQRIGAFVRSILTAMTDDA